MIVGWRWKYFIFSGYRIDAAHMYAVDLLETEGILRFDRYLINFYLLPLCFMASVAVFWLCNSSTNSIDINHNPNVPSNTSQHSPHACKSFISKRICHFFFNYITFAIVQSPESSNSPL